VRAVRQRLALQKSVAGKFLPHLEEGHRPFAAPCIRAHQARARRVRREFGVNLKPCLRRRSLHERHVPPTGLAGAEVVQQGDEHRLAFCQQHYPAGLRVQPVGGHQVRPIACPRPGRAAFDAVVQQPQQARALRLGAVGHGGHAARFIERQHLRIFIENRDFPKLLRGRR